MWRSDLLTGGRILDFVDRLKKFRTLRQYAQTQGWDFGEGFIVGKSGSRVPAKHLTGKDFLPSEAILPTGINEALISKVKDRLFKSAYTSKRYTPPMVLIREQMDLDCGAWLSGYLTYRNKVVGLCGSPRDDASIRNIERWVRSQQDALKAFVAAISVRLFTQKATTLSETDVLSLPYPEAQTLNISAHEQILVDDIVA